MPVDLAIDDGMPWYLSPDIWVVPGDDPDGTPGTPIAGVPAYIWGNVHNRGSSAVQNATVNYYWADPSTVVSRDNATLIGTSSVSLGAGETKPVLCLSPWIPSMLNNGHLCLVAEAFASTDPLLPFTHSEPFNVIGDPQIAQRNLNVVLAFSAEMLRFVFVVTELNRQGDEELDLVVRRAPLGLLRSNLRTLGLERLPEEAPAFGDAELCRHDDGRQDKVGRRAAVSRKRRMELTMRAPEQLAEGTGALFLIEQRHKGEVVGGHGLLFLGAAKKHRGKGDCVDVLDNVDDVRQEDGWKGRD